MPTPHPTLATYEEFCAHYEKSDEEFKRELFTQYQFALKERERHRAKASRRWKAIVAARPPDWQPKKTGRPRKEKPVSTEPKRGPGRPRKIPAEVSGQEVELSA